LVGKLGAMKRTTAGFGIWPWVELARRNDIAVERLCESAGVELTQLREVFVRWPQTVCNRIAQFSCDQFGSDAAMAAALGVEAGQFQLLELLVRTAATVGHGLQVGCWLFPLLHNGGRLVHERLTSGQHTVTWVPPSEYTVHSAYVELTFGVTVLGIRRETLRAGVGAAAVRFRRAAPPQTSAYEQVLGCLPEFGSDDDQIIFDAKVANLRMTRRNRDVHAKARAIAEELIASDET
jgi:Arabinose-binding domain of AraC transcription regulator, N-term